MAYTPTEPVVFQSTIAGIDTTQLYAYGTTVRAKDPTYGEGIFIYLQGVSGNKVGLMVNYKQDAGVVTIYPNTANLGEPIAVSMAANVTTANYSWYQVSGAAVILKTNVKVDPAGGTFPKVYQSGTAGRVMPTSVSGKQILGARFTTTVTVTSTTSTAVVQINRPVAQGQIT
jgi:hypothetical protein